MYTGKCECELGFKLDSLGNSCVKCYYYDEKCMIECPGNTEVHKGKSICKIKLYREMGNTSIIWTCAVLLFLIVVATTIGSKCSYIYGMKKTNL